MKIYFNLDVCNVLGDTEAERIDYLTELCGGVVWAECEVYEQPKPFHSRRLFGYSHGIACYYDFAGDYYFFVDEA